MLMTFVGLTVVTYSGIMAYVLKNVGKPAHQKH